MIVDTRNCFTLFLVLFLVLSPLTLSAAEPPAPQAPAPQPAEPTAAEDLGYGFGSVLVSLFYSPAKVTYAGLGLITGGLGFVLSGGNSEVATNIISPAVRGNYVVTPRHLKGEEPLVFVGPSNSPGPQQPQPAPAPQP